jgi:hypothetical protein
MKEYGNICTVEGLAPTVKDLRKIFKIKRD